MGVKRLWEFGPCLTKQENIAKRVQFNCVEYGSLGPYCGKEKLQLQLLEPWEIRGGAPFLYKPHHRMDLYMHFFTVYYRRPPKCHVEGCETPSPPNVV